MATSRKPAEETASTRGGSGGLTVGHLRIALLTEASSAGVGRHVIDLAFSLQSLGHEVHLLYSAARIDGRFKDGVESLGRIGVKLCDIPMKHNPHPSDLGAVLHIRRYLTENGPFDVLHSHSTKAGMLGRLAGVGVVRKALYTPHAMVTMTPYRGARYRKMAGWLECALANCCNVVVCVSEAEKNHALSIGLPAGKLRIVRNGINPEKSSVVSTYRSELRSTWKIKDDELCIGFVGRLFPQKNAALLLKAIAMLTVEERNAVRFVFVGDGPERSSLGVSARELGLEDRVLFVGDMDGERAMSAFDLFVLPSTYEAFPYVLLEALAQGLPIVSTDVGGARELIETGVNGVVVDDHESASLARGIRLLLSAPERIPEMRSASLEIAKKFTVQAMTSSMVELYRE